jgi:group I intron endonuclease
MITYMATNSINGMFYVGSTVDFEKRKRSHLNSNEPYPFQRALAKHPEKFEWTLFEDDSEEPILEQALLDMWYGKSMCYNLNPYADRPPSQEGRHRPKEEKEKIKVGMITFWDENPELREEYSFRTLREGNSFYGKSHSSETIAKMSRSKQGRTWWRNDKGETKLSRECPGIGWMSGRGKLKTRVKPTRQGQ